MPATTTYAATYTATATYAATATTYAAYFKMRESRSRGMYPRCRPDPHASRSIKGFGRITWLKQDVRMLRGVHAKQTVECARSTSDAYVHFQYSFAVER